MLWCLVNQCMLISMGTATVIPGFSNDGSKIFTSLAMSIFADSELFSFF